MDAIPLICHRCGAELETGRGRFYVVRIEAFADPTPPDITAEDLARNIRSEIDRLMQEMSRLSDQELMDQVYRKLTIFLCNSCYNQWIENPTG